MAYLVLARKYRPQTFEDVVKQDHVTRTLQNAITTDRMAHAVLFSGPRGTGKTTVARILAKALNCENGPAPVPCNQCKSCQEITASGAVDVFEIDGASNNSVDQIRDLRDNVKYMPAHGRFKIYIIDEVHMLSTAAFNALLKTLEEPPPHVLFFFATTEPHKIPLTILSRCQRHDFRRIDVGAITEHLEQVCKKEKFDIPKTSLELISREAGGCMRDALSLLDQVMACAGSGPSQDRILDILGVVDRKMIFDLSNAIISGNVPDILEILDRLHDRGQDMKKLYADLLEHFRNLMVVRLGKNVENLVDAPAHEIESMTRQIQDIPASHISQLFDSLFREEASVRYSAQPKMALEMAFVRMCQLKPALAIDELIAQLETLKQTGTIRITGMVAPVEKDRKENQFIAPNPQAIERDDKNLPRDSQVNGQTSDREENQPQARVDGARPQRPLGAEQNDSKAKDETDRKTERDTNADARPDTASEPQTQQERESESDRDPEFSSARGTQNQPEPESESESAAEPEKSPDPVIDKEALWPTLMEKVKEKHPLLAANMARGSLTAFSRNRMEIEVRGNGFNTSFIEKNAENIREICAELTGVRPQIAVTFNEQYQDIQQRLKAQKEKLKDEAIRHPLVNDALEIFNGKIIDVKYLEEESS